MGYGEENIQVITYSLEQVRAGYLILKFKFSFRFFSPFLDSALSKAYHLLPMVEDSLLEIRLPAPITVQWIIGMNRNIFHCYYHIVFLYLF